MCLGYRGSPVTAQQPGHDCFLYRQNGWETMHPVPDTAPPLLDREEGSLI
jgi:hypothetical protein